MDVYPVPSACDSSCSAVSIVRGCNYLEVCPGCLFLETIVNSPCAMKGVEGWGVRTEWDSVKLETNYSCIVQVLLRKPCNLGIARRRVLRRPIAPASGSQLCAHKAANALGAAIVEALTQYMETATCDA